VRKLEERKTTEEVVQVDSELLDKTPPPDTNEGRPGGVSKRGGGVVEPKKGKYSGKALPHRENTLGQNI